jgi:hypothetical protein
MNYLNLQFFLSSGLLIWLVWSMTLRDDERFSRWGWRVYSSFVMFCVVFAIWICTLGAFGGPVGNTNTTPYEQLHGIAKKNNCPCKVCNILRAE